MSGSGAGPSFGTTEARGQEMQGRKLFSAGCMNIAEEQHVFESIFAPHLISATAFEYLRIFKRTKKHVPKRDVREVVGVMTELMVNPMRFRPLKDEANPRRRFDIPMIEKLSDCDENGVITGGADAGTKQGIYNQTAQDGVEQNFNRMFVKAGNDFQSTRRMMNLMEYSP